MGALSMVFVFVGVWVLMVILVYSFDCGAFGEGR